MCFSTLLLKFPNGFQKERKGPAQRSIVPLISQAGEWQWPWLYQLLFSERIEAKCNATNQTWRRNFRREWEQQKQSLPPWCKCKNQRCIFVQVQTGPHSQTVELCFLPWCNWSLSSGLKHLHFCLGIHVLWLSPFLPFLLLHNWFGLCLWHSIEKRSAIRLTVTLASWTWGLVLLVISVGCGQKACVFIGSYHWKPACEWNRSRVQSV